MNRHPNYLESIDQLKKVDPALYAYLMANHYSKFVDMEDPEFAGQQIVKYYMPQQLYFECEERLSRLLDLQHGKQL